MVQKNGSERARPWKILLFILKEVESIETIWESKSEKLVCGTTKLAFTVLGTRKVLKFHLNNTLD
jgi:hypothetical protein